jgi:outer membrane protein OmpA-like peptidoglycan-associated protein
MSGPRSSVSSGQVSSARMNRVAASVRRGRRAFAPPPRTRPAGPRLGNRRLQRLLSSGTVRAKRDVSRPGDADEVAADRLAADVLARGDHAPCSGCSAAAPCASCGEGRVHRKAEGPGPASSGGEATAALGSGRPLDAASRAFFEPRFGADLGGVRVHDDAAAADAAAGISARAFTTGTHIAFAAGEHRPGSTEGRELLAHELAHVVSPPASSRVARQDMDAGVPDMDAGPGPSDAAVPPPAGAPAGPDPADAGAPAPAGGLLGGLFGGLFGGPGGPCATPAEEAKRDAFNLRFDMHLDRNIPSTTQGMFDARYIPIASYMPVTVKISYKFVDATRPKELVRMFGDLFSGRSIADYFWTTAEEDDFKAQFAARNFARWSAQHVLRSTKPCWGFQARPVVFVAEAASDADAHYVVTVHKSVGPGFDYESGTGFPDLAHPGNPAAADLWQSDVRENPSFNSVAVATNERTRLETALAAVSATPIFFEKDKSDVGFIDTVKLLLFAGACRQMNPSAPPIPIFLSGFASAEGDASHNLTLSLDRALAVESILTGAGVPQPMLSIGFGPVGAPNDPANRRVDIAIDHSFETTYASNRYSVAEHEFGHMLGLADEYMNNTTGGWGTLQTNFMALVTSAGVQGPAVWGDLTSATMGGGVDVLPRYYVTFWEALGRMTAPDIAQNEWSIG